MLNRMCIALLVFGTGCSAQTQAPKTPTPTHEQILALDGPGGSVKIGDPLEQAERAFPLPAGQKITVGSLIYAFKGEHGYAFSQPTYWFEATEKGGKIVCISASYASKSFSDTAKAHKALATQIDKLGKPKRTINSDTSTVYVWDGGDSMRLFTIAKAKPAKPGYGTIIGTKEGFKVMGYKDEG